MKLILKAARAQRNKSLRLRDYALIRLAYVTLLKRRELAALNISDLAFPEGQDAGVYFRGRAIWVDAETAKALRRWIRLGVTQLKVYFLLLVFYILVETC